MPSSLQRLCGAAACLGLLAHGLAAQEPERPALLPLRERARVRDEILRERLDVLVPHLMRREGIDLWVVTGREGAEDPLLETLLPATWLSARRRTILVFHDPGGNAQVQRFALSRYDVGELFRGVWDADEEPDPWRALSREIQARAPERIALDVSPTLAHADGLTKSEHDALVGALPPAYRERVISAEPLALGWLETRTPREADLYPDVCRIARSILLEGFEQAVHPGVTTTDDLAWWYRERAAELHLEVWFHPLVSLQRPGARAATFGFADEDPSRVIRRGDLLHVDFGIRYLGLCTDMQQHAYVLRLGEREAPASLTRGLALAADVQDLVAAAFRTGRSGDEVLAESLAAARKEALQATVYSHPLGLHGHGAGPLIGLWDQQSGVPGRGALTLSPGTAWSIELAVRAQVPEWGLTEVDFMVEDNAWFDGEDVVWLAQRSEGLPLIR